MVPVTEIHYTWKRRTGKFYLYGYEHKVHAPDYPQTCCWGCSILWNRICSIRKKHTVHRNQTVNQRENISSFFFSFSLHIIVSHVKCRAITNRRSLITTPFFNPPTRESKHCCAFSLFLSFLQRVFFLKAICFFKNCIDLPLLPARYIAQNKRPTEQKIHKKNVVLPPLLFFSFLFLFWNACTFFSVLLCHPSSSTTSSKWNLVVYSSFVFNVTAMCSTNYYFSFVCVDCNLFLLFFLIF